MQAASATIWRTTKWCARWMPFAFLACFSVAATLYLAHVTREVERFEYWGLFFIGVSAFAAVGAMRRARGVPLWDAPLRRRQRLVLALASAALAGLVALELGTVVMTILDRGASWLPRAPILAFRILGGVLLHSGMTLVLIAMSLAASGYLLRASGVRGRILTFILGVDLGMLHGPTMLPRYAPVLAEWPHIGEVIGVVIGLSMAFALWMVGGAAITAQELEYADDTMAASARAMSPAAWAGFRRFICLAVAIPAGVVLFSPTPFYGAPGLLILLSEMPALAGALLGIFIICVWGARAAKRAVGYHDRGAYLHGKRVAACSLVLFITVMGGVSVVDMLSMLMFWPTALR